MTNIHITGSNHRRTTSVRADYIPRDFSKVVSATGTAKCHRSDKFNYQAGEELATARALRELADAIEAHAASYIKPVVPLVTITDTPLTPNQVRVKLDLPTFGEELYDHMNQLGKNLANIISPKPVVIPPVCTAYIPNGTVTAESATPGTGTLYLDCQRGGPLSYARSRQPLGAWRDGLFYPAYISTLGYRSPFAEPGPVHMWRFRRSDGRLNTPYDGTPEHQRAYRNGAGIGWGPQDWQTGVT